MKGYCHLEGRFRIIKYFLLTICLFVPSQKIKRKTINITLSENLIEKSQKEATLIQLTHKHMNATFPLGTNTSMQNGRGGLTSFMYPDTPSHLLLVKWK